MTATFQLRRVTVSYPDIRALAAVDLQVDPGEAVAIVGPSGAGKTTLLRLLNGSARPTSGTVAVGGERLSEMSPRRLREARASIGFVHQDLRLVPNLRVLQNVTAGQLGRLSTLGAVRALVWPPRDAVRQVHEMERVGIPEKLFASTDRLSGGQRQRVAVARALFQQPVALLPDEPVSSVDPARARDLVQLLVEISAERGLTLCVSLHNLELARDYFPRVVGLRHGRIAFDRPPSTLAQGEIDALFRLETAGDRA